jgi:hypothetical protein
MRTVKIAQSDMNNTDRQASAIVGWSSNVIWQVW